MQISSDIGTYIFNRNKSRIDGKIKTSKIKLKNYLWQKFQLAQCETKSNDLSTAKSVIKILRR
jgi:hypothetical protein